jgi:hypothetical protein
MYHIIQTEKDRQRAEARQEQKAATAVAKAERMAKAKALAKIAPRPPAPPPPEPYKAEDRCYGMGSDGVVMPPRFCGAQPVEESTGEGFAAAAAKFFRSLPIISYRIKYQKNKQNLHELKERAREIDEFAGGLGIADEDVDMMANVSPDSSSL